MKYALCIALCISLAFAQAPKTPSKAPTLQEVMKALSMDDQQKLRVLWLLMVDAHQQPVRWNYRILELKSSMSAAKLDTVLNYYGAAGYELVSSTPLSGSKTRYILKAKYSGAPNSI